MSGTEQFYFNYYITVLSLQYYYNTNMEHSFFKYIFITFG